MKAQQGLFAFMVWVSLFLTYVSGKNAFHWGRSSIVGGSEVEPHSLPWQVKIDFGYMCGGTIICPQYIMTAGHCAGAEASEYNVYVGVHNKKTDCTEENRHTVEEVHQHPKFWEDTHRATPHYDYGILKLREPIQMRSEAKAIFLARFFDEYNKDTLFVTSGWGGWEFPDKLNAVTLPWISKKDCQVAYNHTTPKHNIEPQMMCAGDLMKGKIDSCKGDSGGPLAWLDPNWGEVKLAGIVSWGEGCAQARQPGVYSDLQDQLDWISGVTGDCNFKTCYTPLYPGNCVTKDDLVASAIERFENETPHLVVD